MAQWSRLIPAEHNIVGSNLRCDYFLIHANKFVCKLNSVHNKLMNLFSLGNTSVTHVVFIYFYYYEKKICANHKLCCYGLMDKAPAYGARDSGFESQ